MRDCAPPLKAPLVALCAMQWIDFRLPPSGFACPLDLWSACHDRGRRVAFLLHRLFRHLVEHGPSDATRVTAAEVQRYLTEAAPRHHADEDLDLFPRLQRRLDGRGADIADAESAAEALQRLAQEHERIESLWAPLRGALEQVRERPATAAQCALADDFIDRFLPHHALEEEVILPVARRALNGEDLAAIGAAMAARRGTTWAALAAGQRN
jgi:hemerythrin-like domain-containing protein